MASREAMDDMLSEVMEQNNELHALVAASLSRGLGYIMKDGDKLNFSRFVQKFLTEHPCVKERKEWCLKVSYWLFIEIERPRFYKHFMKNQWGRLASMIANQLYEGIGRWRTDGGDNNVRDIMEGFEFFILKDFDPKKMMKSVFPTLECLRAFACKFRDDEVDRLYREYASLKDENEDLRSQLESKNSKFTELFTRLKFSDGRIPVFTNSKFEEVTTKEGTCPCCMISGKYAIHKVCPTIEGVHGIECTYRVCNECYNKILEQPKKVFRTVEELGEEHVIPYVIYACPGCRQGVSLVNDNRRAISVVETNDDGEKVESQWYLNSVTNEFRIVNVVNLLKGDKVEEADGDSEDEMD